MAIFKECLICKGKKRQPRNGRGGRTCTANECKSAYKEQRAEQPTAGLALGAGAAVQQVDERMPAGMWVHEIEEILGERCCELLQLSNKKRKNGPGSACKQEFLVRGTFLEDDGDEDDDEEDASPEPNTFWVLKDDLLATIAVGDIKTALQERHEAIMEDLYVGL